MVERIIWHREQVNDRLRHLGRDMETERAIEDVNIKDWNDLNEDYPSHTVWKSGVTQVGKL